MRHAHHECARFATVRDVPEVNSRGSDRQRWASELSEEQLRCRDTGHRWSDWTVRFLRPAQAYEQVLICACETQRVRLISTTGEVLESRYRYPADYLAPPGVDARSAAGRADLRLTHVLRQVDRAPSSAVVPLRRRRSSAS